VLLQNASKLQVLQKVKNQRSGRSPGWTAGPCCSRSEERHRDALTGHRCAVLTLGPATAADSLQATNGGAAPKCSPPKQINLSRLL